MNFGTRAPLRSLALLGLSLALLPAACSDDDRPAPISNGGTAGTAGTAGSGGSAGSGGVGGSSSGGSSSGGTGGECTETTEVVQNCIDTGTAGCDEVTICACTNCACLLAECVADEGCTEIRACATEKRCTGATCAGPEYCQDVINQYGGLTGASAGLGLRITKCLTDAECPAFCPVDGGTGGTGGTGGAGGSAGTGGAAGSAGTGGTTGGAGGTGGTANTGGSAGASSSGGAAGSAAATGGSAGAPE